MSDMFPKYRSMMSSGAVPLAVEEYPRAQNRLPRRRFVICASLCWVLWDDLLVILRTTSPIGRFKQTGTNMWM